MSKEQTSPPVKKVDLQELCEFYIGHPFKIQVIAEGSDLRFDFLAVSNSEFSAALFARTLRHYWTAQREEGTNILYCQGLADSPDVVQVLAGICTTLRSYGWAVEVK